MRGLNSWIKSVWCGCVVAAMSLPAVARDDTGLLRDRAADQRPTLLVLGTSHLDNPGLDVVNNKVDDVLAPARQAEITAVVEQLATYRPTHIAVEWPIKKQAALDSAKSALTEFESANSGLLARAVASTGGSKPGGPMLFRVEDTIDPNKCWNANSCSGSVKLVALSWTSTDNTKVSPVTSTPTTQLGIDVFAKPKGAAAKKPPSQLTGGLVYATNDPTFWHVGVHFDGDLPPSGQLAQLIWIPNAGARTASKLASGCSAQLDSLPAGEAKDILEPLGNRVSIDSVGGEARFVRR